MFFPFCGHSFQFASSRSTSSFPSSRRGAKGFSRPPSVESHRHHRTTRVFKVRKSSSQETISISWKVVPFWHSSLVLPQ